MFSSPHFSSSAPPPPTSRPNIPPPILSLATAFRINTSASVDFSHLKVSWNQRLRKTGGWCPLMVNQISDEEICPDERSEEGSLPTRDDRRSRPGRDRTFRPGRKACLPRGASRRVPSPIITSLPLCVITSRLPRPKGGSSNLIRRGGRLQFSDFNFRLSTFDRQPWTPVERRLDYPNLLEMLKWFQGATRFRRKLSRPEGMPGPTCP